MQKLHEKYFGYKYSNEIKPPRTFNQFDAQECWNFTDE